MTPTAQSAGLEQRARELLAAEYERDDLANSAEYLRADPSHYSLYDSRAIRAIVAALSAPAADGVLTLTLTVREIADLADFAGLNVAAPDDDSADTEITVRDCPPEGVRNEGEPSDPDSVSHYNYIAYCTDYPDEGCVGLGLELPAAPQAQGVR